MPFITPPLDTIRRDQLRDIRNLLQLTEAETGSDSDWFVRASAVASVAEGLYQHQAWIVRQIFPDTADGEYLAMHARTRGLTKKPGTTAGGTVTLTGATNAAAPAGLTAQRDGKSWVTTEAGAAGQDGKLTVKASATVTGTAGNTSAAQTATLAGTPFGFDSTVTVSAMTGGTDAETDAALLDRLLELIRRPPAGGNKYDYRRWALEVAGVSAAYVYPLRRGPGTVDVVVTSAGGLPSADTLKAVQAHIDDVRPVTAKNALVLAPAARAVDVTVKVSLSGLTLDAAKVSITKALGDYIAALAPGETFVRSQAETQISLITGVTDRSIVTPAGNVSPEVSDKQVEWLRPGKVEVSLL